MTLSPEAFDKAAQSIRLLILDMDGVLTDGSILVGDTGEQARRYHVRDGFAIRCWQRVGYPIAVITGRYGRAVAYRCRELGIDDVVQNRPEKGSAFREVIARHGRTPEEVAVVGDDLPDVPMMLSAGLGCAVGDADVAVRQAADWICSFPGGKGAVREVITAILTAQGKWQSVLDHYRQPA